MHVRTHPATTLLVAGLIAGVSIALGAVVVPAAAAPTPAPPAAKAAPSAVNATPSAVNAARGVGAPGHASAAVKFKGGRLAAARFARAAAGTGTAIAHVDADVSANPEATTVRVTVHGSPAAVSAAIRAAGGEVVAGSADAVSAVVATSALPELAANAAVQRISRSVPAFTAGAVSEGVHASNADSWQAADIKGAGVKVAIVDGGFAGLADEVAMGNLPAGLTVVGNHCGTDVDTSEHGTAVAEIVHQMAPSARLYLYCVSDSLGFQTAESELQAAGIKIVNSSLGFPGDSRGDGTGPAGSTAQTVAKARKAGILWIQSAGNSGLDHWGGTLVRDPAAPNLVLLNPAEPHSSPAVDTANVDEVEVIPGSSGAAVLQWDNWPASNLLLTLMVQRFDLDTGNPIGSPVVYRQTPGTTPVLYADLSSHSGTDYTGYLIAVGLPSGAIPALHFDLSYWGGVTYSYFATGYPDSAGALSSITEPASSPYVVAVGAVDASRSAGTCDPATTSSSRVEPFSSRGPTIDGRVKPDLMGYDATAANLNEVSPFCGTSAAAPHVAGAAALIASANPSLDASQIQALLQDRAGTAVPGNVSGHGWLRLGATTGVAPRAGTSYSPLTAPIRVLDTRTSNGNHLGRLNPTQTVSVNVQAPAGATAVAINLTGTAAAGSTYLSAYPGTTVSKTSNLNLSALDPTAAVFAVVTLAPDRRITIRNSSAAVHVVVDVLGYFSPTGADKYTAAAPSRIFSTVTGTGGKVGKLTNQIVSVRVPTGADAVVVNVTAAGSTTGGYFSVNSTGAVASSTLNFGTTPRANLAMVKVATDGTIKLHVVGGPVNAIVDLLGVLKPTGAARYVALPSPVRIIDTRTGNGGRHGPLGKSTTQLYTGSGVGEIPYAATALMGGVTAVANGATSYVIVYPATGNRPVVSTVNVTTGRIAANAAAITLAGHDFDVYNSDASMSVVVDVFGYFAA